MTTPRRSEDLGEVLEFMRLLWSITHGLQTTSKRMHASLGLTGPQRLVIRVVGRFPHLTAGELASILHLDPSTLTGILRRLEKRRLIKRRTDARDARRIQLSLTKSGRRFDVETAATVEGIVSEAIREIPRRKLDAARDVLVSVAKGLARPLPESRR